MMQLSFKSVIAHVVIAMQLLPLVVQNGDTDYKN